MSDESKKILVDVSVETKEAIKAIAATKAQISELKKAQKELDVTTAEGSAAYEAYAAQIRQLSNAARQQQKEVDNTIKAQLAEKGSMEQLKATLSNLTAEYNRMSAVQRESAEGKELQASILETTNALKEQEQGVGNNTRSVGDYKNQIIAAVNELRELKDTTSEMKKEQQQLQAANQTGTDEYRLLSKAIEDNDGKIKLLEGSNNKLTTTLSNLPGPTGQVIKTLEGMGKTMWTLSANPLGATIMVIAAGVMLLVAAFKKTVDTIKNNEEQSNRLTTALAPLKAIGDAVTRVFEKLGETLISAAEGFGKVVSWMADLVGASKEVNQSTQDYINLEKEKQKLIQDTRQLNVDASKAEVEIAELRNNIAQK